MERAEFRRAVRYGLGRAILHLRKHPTGAYNDIILDACLNNDVFDQQVNGNRGWYLHQVMIATGKPKWFRDRLIAMLEKQTPNDPDDDSLVAALLALFAKHGDAEARHALYVALERDPTWDQVQEALVHLDGLDGLVRVARAVGSLDVEPTGERAGQPDDALYEAEALFDESEIWERLEAEAVTDPAVRKYVDWMQPIFWPLSRIQPRPERPYISFDEFEALVGRPLSERVNPRWWGIQANDEDLLKAAQVVVETSDDDVVKLRRYVWIFLARAFPLEPTRLIELVDSADEYVAWRSLSALENVSHPDVRELAFRLHDVEDRRRSRWVGLLANNYVSGDAERFQQAILHDTEEEAIHNYGFAIEHMIKEQGRPELVPLLITLYDRTPCGACRGRFVRLLYELGRLPEWMIEESWFDGYPYLREFIEGIEPSA